MILGHNVQRSRDVATLKLEIVSQDIEKNTKSGNRAISEDTKKEISTIRYIWTLIDHLLYQIPLNILAAVKTSDLVVGFLNIAPIHIQLKIKLQNSNFIKRI